MAKKKTAKSKPARKPTARKTVRKAAKKTARKTVKKKAKKAVRKAVKKTVRKAAKKKVVKKVTRKKVARKTTAKKKTVARKTAAKSVRKKVVRKTARKTVKKATRKVAKKAARKVTRKTTRNLTRKSTPPPAPEVTREIIEPAAIKYTPPPAPVIDTEETNGPLGGASPAYDESCPETGPSSDYDRSRSDIAASAATPSTGSPAPAFELRDANGAFHTLSQYAGRRLVLFFYPKDDTPGCTSEVCGFRDVYGDFDTQDAVLLGVSPDSCESHYQFATKFNLPYPLLSDPEHRTAEAYGAWGEKTQGGETYMGVKRTTFIIDEEGQIAKVYQDVDPDGHHHEVVSWLGESHVAQPSDPYASY